MKIVLTIEEMKLLEEVGFDTSDASMLYIKCPMVNEITDVHLNNGQYENGDCYTYTLQDILDKLPQKIHLYPDDNSLNNTAFFTMNKMAGGGYFMAYEQSWDDVNGKLKIVMHGRQQKDSAIDAAYNLLIWCKKNNFI